ncbi:SMP-30/gluconolactonase/LRE family protein [Amycolatopsis acidiphila]|uniref:SMP-30/gluconolactonase/LRE family protein n=1 Tax=Amycolatopsis acidiphila TaxID=715473 RepID=UPI0019B7A3E5|nr:hypothetical protein GCM10017788_75550 [Amycolatopsis acidiphila]
MTTGGSSVQDERLRDLEPEGRLECVTGEPVTCRSPGNMANGNTYDRQGRLLTCELADRYDGRELNSPNDVIVASDGTIYFTDPGYGRDPRYGVRRLHVRRFTLGEWAVTGGEVWPQTKGSAPGVPDGMKIDSLGNLGRPRPAFPLHLRHPKLLPGTRIG